MLHRGGGRVRREGMQESDDDDESKEEEQKQANSMTRFRSFPEKKTLKKKITRGSLAVTSTP